MSDLSLDNIVTNNMNFKHLETTKDITISIKNENGFPQRPDATHTWTAKVSDGTNFVGDYAVKINQNSLIVDSEGFTKLPVGSYQLEVWEEWIDPDGTKQRSIYPSPSQTIPFTIYANLTDQAEKEIKSIGFQDVVDQAVMNVWNNYVIKVNMIESDQAATVVQSAADGKNYVTFNIPRGDVGPAPTLKIGTVTKLNPDQTPTANVSGDNGAYTLDLGIPQGAQGKTGTVDNAGLINAPAFQSLQTQVNNSAVGTNLLLGTSNSQDYTLSGSGFTSRSQSSNGKTKSIPCTPGASYTYSVIIKSATYDCYPQIQFFNSNKDMTLNSSDFPSKDTGMRKITAVAPENATFMGVRILLSNPPDSQTIVFNSEKLELGSHATDWCPNPSEILTQSDYAKIQAAIVALGGSLS